MTRESLFDFARTPRKFRSLIKQVRKNGYGYSDRDTISNGCTLAAAIRRGDPRIASVNIIVPASTMAMEEIETRFGPRIIDLAKRVSKALVAD